MKRVPFNGVIEGSVIKRCGESDAEAIARAERIINNAMGRDLYNYSREGDSGGPIVGLEPI